MATVSVKRKCFEFHGGVPNVRQAIIVRIPEIGAHSRKRRTIRSVGHACQTSDLLESLPTKIVKQEVAGGVVGHKSVQEAVAVVVGKGHTHAFTKLRSDPGLLGHISESSVPVVSIERIVRCRVVLGMTVAAGTAADRAIGIFINLPL